MLKIVAFDAKLNRNSFTCGEAALDRYFREQVSQDARRLIANCFIAFHENTIAGLYTLSRASIPVNDLPDDLAKRLPRYPVLPAIRIGRLAVDTKFQGKGVGSALLVDAMRRALRTDAAGFTLLVEAKNERAAGFYQHHVFISLESRPGTLFLPLATVAKAFV